MSQTIYARVPDQIKEAADEYAAHRGMTLASAVADLLDRGLQGAADEQSIAGLEQRVAELSAENHVLRERELAIGSAYQVLADRIGRPVGVCPHCQQAISGYDLLVTGRCRNPDCAKGLSGLLGPSGDKSPAKNTLDDGEFKILLGALGVALGVAYLTQGGR